MKKIAVITGAAGNLGKSVVNKFIAEGYVVIGLVYKKSDTIVDKNINYEEIVVDLSNEEETQKCIDEIIKRYEKIDVAVLTAGGFAMGNINSTSAKNILDQYKLNFETAYNVARPVFIKMAEKNNGRIFLIGSKAGLDATKAKATIAYSISKSLIFRLAELLNDEAKGKNVVVNVIVPGTIDTPPNRKSMPDANFSDWSTPDQIAEIIFQYSGKENEIIREPVIKVYNRS